jgi:hypothetical protein
MTTEIGKRYVHYKKGTVYLVLAIGRLEPDGMKGEEYVIYQAVAEGPEEDMGLTWIRARKDFETKVERNGQTVQRFTLIT